MPLGYARSALAALLVALALAGPARAQTYVGVIDPAGTPLLHDLDWRDGYLWATDRIADAIVKIDPATGAVVATVTPGFEPVGLAFDGTNFRVSPGFTSSNPRISTVSPAGAVLGTIPAPSSLTNGLTFYDGGLWAANAYPDGGNSIVRLDAATGAVLETVPFPSTQPTGIAFTSATTVWVSNAGDDSGSSGTYDTYEIDRTTGAVLRTLPPPEGMTRPRGIAYDGSRYLYIAFRASAVPQESYIYKVDLQAAGNAHLELSAETLDFGTVVQGDSATRPLTLTNTGDGPLVVSDVSFLVLTARAEGGGGFCTTTLTDTTLAAGTSVTASVTYHAGSPYSLDGCGALTFSTNDVARPEVQVPVVAWDAFTDPTAFLLPPPSFGDVRIDPGPSAVSSTATRRLVVMNYGAPPLVISGITFSDPAFSVVGTAFPLTLSRTDTRSIEIEFRPTEVRAYSATATLASNDPAGSRTFTVTGNGISPTISGGAALWTWQIPENPATSSSERKVFAMAAVPDVTGDGLPEFVVAARNYWTLMLDPNGWTEPRRLWSFSSCPNNNNCGAVSGNQQLFEYGLEVTGDLNRNGSADVVIGTEGGNDHVYALDGRTGQTIWSVGSDTDPYLASYYSVSARVDVTGDGIPEVATGTGSASAESPNPYNHRRVYLLNGGTGAQLWEASTGQANFRTLLYRSAAGPRVATGGGEGTTNVLVGYDAATGTQAWAATPPSAPFIIEPIPTAAGATTEDLLVGGLDGALRRYSGATGALTWTGGVLGQSVWDVAVLDRAAGPPLVAVGSSGTSVVALEGATGELAWTYDLQGQTFDVAVVQDVDGDGTEDVAATGRFGRTVLLSGETGGVIWSHTFGNDTFDQSGEVVAAIPDLDGNGTPEVAFGTRDGRVVLLHGGQGVRVAGEPGAPPTALTLAAPAPNPVRGNTALVYTLPAAADVRLAVYDALGRRVWQHAATETAGRHLVSFDAGALAAGLYVVRLEAGAEARAQRLVVR